jgi:outer membrane lipoprotein carrier protein
VKKILFFGLLVSLMMVSSPLAFAQDSLDDVIKNLQERYDETKDFSSVFTQETITKSLGAPAIVNGKVYFKKPGMVRWEYTDPIVQDIISDGETLWLYLPDDKQVRIYKAAEAFGNQAFLGFLFGEGEITDDFETALGELDAEKAQDYYLLMLAPKDPESTIYRILLLVDKENYLIHQVNTYDILGNVTRIAFKDIATNSGLKNSLFHFIVPPGVETIKIESEPGGGGAPEHNLDVEIIEKDE